MAGNVNSDQLRTFLSLAKTGNFSRTSEQMSVAQSTVSKRIQELEKETAQLLFVRDRAGVTLTGAGYAFWEYAHQMVNMEEAAYERMRRTNRFSGHLVLGAVYAYNQLYMTDLLRTFMVQYPDVSVRIRSAHTSVLLQEIRQAKLDIAFTHHPFSHPEFICQCLTEDDVVLVTDAQNQSYAQGIRYDEIKELPLIHTNFITTTTYHWLFPRSHQFQLETEVAIDALPLLRGEQWYAFLARRLVTPQLASGELIEIPIRGALIPPVQYYVIYRKASLKQQIVKNWLTML